MGRSPCCDKPHTNKGIWSKDEDDKLISYVTANGEGRWRSLPKAAGLQRCGKSCRLRWMNYLRPDLKRGNFTQKENQTIIRLHRKMGNKWSAIAVFLKGRTDNEIKNYWNTHIKRELLKQGIDPQTHQPINIDLNNVPTTVVGSRFRPRAVELPVTINLNVSTTAVGSWFCPRAIKVIRSNEDAVRSIGTRNVVVEEDVHIGLNLELSLGPPNQSYATSDECAYDSTSTVDTALTIGRTPIFIEEELAIKTVECRSSDML